MGYSRTKAEAEYKKEWQEMKLEMRKNGMPRKNIKLAAKACRQAFNNDRRYYDNTFAPSHEKYPMRLMHIVLTGSYRIVTAIYRRSHTKKRAV